MTFLGSLPSSPFIPKPNSIPHLSLYHNNNPNPNPRFLLPVLHHHHHRRTLITFKFSTNSDKKIIKDDESPPIVSEVKKSFAVATGELFLGLASRIIKRTQVINGGRSDTSEVPIKIFRERENLEQEEVVVEKVEEYLSGRGRVVVVEEDPGVIWEQPLKDLEAEMGRKKVSSPGFSFSAAGLLFPYHLGVAEFLIEKGYIKETTPLAGSSAGAIVCVVIASGSSMKEALEATKVLAKDCRLKGTAFRLGAVLRNVLEEFLPDDVHIRSNGRVRVAVTQIFWRPRGLLVDQFESKEDLIDAVFTSSFIPGYLAPRPATLFRNRLCIDGGLTLFMPPTSAAKTVRICAFPTDRLGFKGIGISPDCNPENRATPRQLLNWALEPAEDYILDRLFEFGYLDAAVWAEQNPVEETVEDYNRSTTADC
ncbi:Patatin/Phospholipase A2-related [Macleaya cordata]|uniref:Patatin n=1 Tax=Macleaya cordata TaxID=56857 RepID=A0A200QXP6_MACCD|nr:Patatin/Phospholipase A2-related [Macleaya cordata]